MVLIFSLLVNWVIAEAVFYFLFPQPVYAIRYSPWGWEHVPQIRYKFVTESKETVSTIEYNSDGFRGSQEYDHRPTLTVHTDSILLCIKYITELS